MILPMFVLLMFTTGIAIDLVLHETDRADAQNAVDRCLLAVTSRTQTGNAQDICRDYVAKRPYANLGSTCTEPNLVDQSGPGFRKYTASMDCSMTTAFARLAGQPQFNIPAVAGAVEGGVVEISLVLDISGSMAANTARNTTEKRLAVLRASAKEFVTAVLNGPNGQNVSISLIPYSGQVNAGPFFDYLIDADGRDHMQSSCIEFRDEDFATISLPPEGSRGQTPVFQWFLFEGPGGRGYEADWGWCPNDARAIVPFANDEQTLHDAIDDFRAHDGTGTQIGMKWGLALLDPATQPIIRDLADVSVGVVPQRFADRPLPFERLEVDKIIVLMTDGNIRYQNRPSDEVLANLNDTGSKEERAYWAQPRFNGSGNIINLMSAGSNRQYTEEPNLNVLSGIDEPLRTSQFLALCDLAKSKKIRIFTIGFDISETSDAYGEMRDCASDAADFFFVEGLDLNLAFNEIAKLVQRLRLIQ